jgi:MFS family permease
MSYFQLLRSRPRILVFGLLAAFLSSFGQTFFVGTFGDAWRLDFGLSNTEYGGIYSLATLASALVLGWSGSFIDRMPLRRFGMMVALGLAGACLLTSRAQGPITLGLGLFGLRQMGQGLMSHTSMTTMARRFERQRGKAVSLAALGFPIGQTFLPALAVIGIAALGWRSTWILAAIALLLITPILVWLPGSSGRGTAGENEAGSEEASHSSPSETKSRESGWARNEVLKDPRFYLLLPAAVGPGLILTGVFFHQGQLTAAKAWPEGWFAGWFFAFAAAQIGASILTGPLVDRFSALRLMRWYLLPLILGLLVLSGDVVPVLAPLFLALAGLSAGASMTIGGAVWAELYGVRHLGAIRSKISSIGVTATALAPAGMGLLLDAGLSMDRILQWLAIYAIGSLVAVWGAIRGRETSLPDDT